MCHDWMFEVLEDLRTYAIKNGLPATASLAEETLRVGGLEAAQSKKPHSGPQADSPQQPEIPN